MTASCHLFSPIAIRGANFRNRIAVSPMCQYSSREGMPSDWHLVHLGSRAVGGAALVMVEATAVAPEGRISLQDMGLWDDRQIEPLSRLTAFIREQGALAGIQLAHAGRKAGTLPPWLGGRPLSQPEGAWMPLAPSAVPFDDGFRRPESLDHPRIIKITNQFCQAASRAVQAGFSVIEIHSAHGYLLHSFLSPLANFRDDQYGGGLPNRMRLLLNVVKSVRREIGEQIPLFVRISATDWASGGWDLDQSITLCRELSLAGADLVDCSSGGIAPGIAMPVAPGYQVEFAKRIRRDCGILTAAVGMITSPHQADGIIRSQDADLVFLGREMLRDPYWALHAAKALGHKIDHPVQYLRA